MENKPANGPTQELGRIMIQGMAKGSSIKPDSPESAGFFDATKNIQAKAAAANDRKKTATAKPAHENRKTGFNAFLSQY